MTKDHAIRICVGHLRNPGKRAKAIEHLMTHPHLIRPLLSRRLKNLRIRRYIAMRSVNSRCVVSTTPNTWRPNETLQDH